MTEVIEFKFDVETTGLDAEKNDIISLAFILERGNLQVKEQILMRPLTPETAHPRALEVHGYSLEELSTFPPPEEGLAMLFAAMDIMRGDDDAIFLPFGYNVGFDVRFLKAFWRKMGQSNYSTYFSDEMLDVFKLVKRLNAVKSFGTPNLKLETMAKRFDIPISAHDALSDIMATSLLYDRLIDIPESEILVPKGDEPFPMGKWKGVPYDEVPIGYFTWLKEQPWLGDWPQVKKYIESISWE